MLIVATNQGLANVLCDLSHWVSARCLDLSISSYYFIKAWQQAGQAIG